MPLHQPNIVVLLINTIIKNKKTGKEVTITNTQSVFGENNFFYCTETTLQLMEEKFDNPNKKVEYSSELINVSSLFE
jgi:hypothetical protein